MEKKIIRGLVFIILIISTLGCKTSNLPKHKKYQQMETFIEINGLKIPTLSEDKKSFKDTKAFKNDRKNSIDSGEAVKMFSKTSINQNEISTYQKSINDEESYRRATKDYLIKQPGNLFEDITYDINDDDGCIYKMKRYWFKDDKLHTVGTYLTMSLNLSEPIEINGKRMTEVHSGLKYSCVYFPNGQLKSYSVYNGGMRFKDDTVGFNTDGISGYIGTWYKFDENGNIIQTIDFEKNFKTSFLDVLLITRKKLNELFLKGKPDLFHRGLPGYQRNKNENGAFWQLFISPYYFMIIDDATGKIIEEVESADHDEVQKKFSKYMNPTVEHENTIKEFFQN